MLPSPPFGCTISSRRDGFKRLIDHFCLEVPSLAGICPKAFELVPGHETGIFQLPFLFSTLRDFPFKSK